MNMKTFGLNKISIVKINFTLLILLAMTGCKNQGDKGQTESENIEYPLLENGYIEELDPSLGDIISKDSRIDILADGHEWTEGPLWLEKENMLLYSDIPRNAVYSWREREGVAVYLQPSGYSGEGFEGEEPGSNGLLLDLKGNLVLCQHGNRQIAWMETPINDPAPIFESIVDRYDGKRLNSPNDAVFKSNGELYFTDPPYGLPEQMEDPGKELPFQGVFRLDTEGNLHLLTDELSRPNGIAFSPDEKTLYVANSDPDRAIWMAYDVNNDGSINNERILFDASDRTKKEKGLPDGMKVDKDGFVYASGPGGVLIFNPEGKLLGVIHTGQATSNCAFNTDESELFITADMYLLRVKLVNR